VKGDSRNSYINLYIILYRLIPLKEKKVKDIWHYCLLYQFWGLFCQMLIFVYLIKKLIIAKFETLKTAISSNRKYFLVCICV